VKEYRNPPNVHQPIAAYTHQIDLSGPERLLFLSGQVGRTIDGTVPDDPIEQLDQSFRSFWGKAIGYKLRRSKICQIYALDHNVSLDAEIS
jgi:enamine deaminase RidA (YjgF/YER057c/UK114 family)